MKHNTSLFIILNLVFLVFGKVSLEVKILNIANSSSLLTSTLLKTYQSGSFAQLGNWKIISLEPVHSNNFASSLSKKYDNCILLNDQINYAVSYSVDSKNKVLNFAQEANVEGWLGLGFNENGKMDGGGVGSDIVLGFLEKNGSGFVSDYFTSLYDKPVLDVKQDVEVVSVKKVDSKMILEWKRKFDTNDTQDRVIDPNKYLKLIWAANTKTLPESKSLFSKHTHASVLGVDVLLNRSYSCNDTFGFRITFDIPISQMNIENFLSQMNKFLGTEKQLYVVDIKVIEDPCPGCKIIETTFKNYTVPPVETTYVCSGFVLPVDKPYHIVRFEIIRDNPQVLHHIVLFQATKPWFTGTTHECDSLPQNLTPMYAWAPGSDHLDLPPNVGFLIGNSTKYVLIQCHYHNPGLLSGINDSSGVRLFLSDKLREHDAGFMAAGVRLKDITIPPKKEKWHLASLLPSDSTHGINDLPGKKLHIFSYFFHQHLLGRQSWLEIIRNNEKIKEISELKYDFNSQHFVPIDFDLLPGDQIVSHCVWSSKNRNVTTIGGDATTNEMCVQVFLVYPVARIGGLFKPTKPVSCDYPCSEQTWREIIKSEEETPEEETPEETPEDFLPLPVVLGIFSVFVVVIFISIGVYFYRRTTKDDISFSPVDVLPMDEDYED